MRPTLNYTYRDRVRQHTNNKEQLNRKEHKNAPKRFHRHTVHIEFNIDSKQLGTPPPNIAEEDETLLHVARFRLAQLRTGYCLLLKCYLRRISNNIDNCCPKCEVAPHDENQLFNCSKNTTRLKVLELCERLV